MKDSKDNQIQPLEGKLRRYHMGFYDVQEGMVSLITVRNRL